MAAGALGCVAYFRAAERDWKTAEFKVEYGGEALEKADGRVASTEYNLWRAMTIGAEKLPPRLGVRAVCLLPHSETGLAEVVGAVETVLRDRGALGPGEGLPPDWIGGPSAAAETPRAALRRVLALLGPRPLVAQEPPGEVCVPDDGQPTYHPGCHVGLPPLTAPGRCLSGFDRNEHTGQCEATPPPPPLPPPPPPTSGSGGGTPPPPEPEPEPEPACTDEQIAIAAEYNDPVAWPCTKFVDAVTPGTGTHGHTSGYIDSRYDSGRQSVMSGVGDRGITGVDVDSDWRCPTGNDNVGGRPNSQHKWGLAGDFHADQWSEVVWRTFADIAHETGSGWNSGYGSGSNCPEGLCYLTYIHIDWR